MIIAEVAAVPMALESLLQVERIASLDPLRAFSEASSGAPGARAAPLPAATSTATSTSPPGTIAPATTATLIAALPLGSAITARVVDVPAANHVVADIGDLRVALSWPAASGVAPQPGQDLMLRVLAHQPMLLFQSIEPETPNDRDDNVHWSSDAMRLQASGSTATTPLSSTGPLRFDIPILEIEIEPLPAGEADDADARDRASGVAHGSVARGASPVTTEQSSEWYATPSPASHASNIALDDVIVGRTTALVDGVEAPLTPHVQDNAPSTLPFSPLVLQGPAWDGQPMELVVRRERDDELFENPVLDHWCGEVTIDLPHLGRVAGHLSFSMQGLRVRIEGDDERSVMTMSAAAGELAAALAHADLRVAGLTVAGRSADTTRTERGAGVDLGYGVLNG